MHAGRISIAAAVTYWLIFLMTTGDLSWQGDRWFWRIAETWPARIFEMRAPLLFEGVAMLSLGHPTLIISPMNLLIGGILAILVGLNVHGAIRMRQATIACRSRLGGGLMASLPALLAGGACCAPALLLLLGIPALGAFVSFFPWLIPLSAAALFLNRIWQRRQGVS